MKKNNPILLMIKRGKYIFFVKYVRLEDITDIQSVLMKLYEKHKNHPIFKDYVNTGWFTFFHITTVHLGEASYLQRLSPSLSHVFRQKLRKKYYLENGHPLYLYHSLGTNSHPFRL